MQISWKVYVPLLGVIFLLVLGGMLFLSQPFFSPQVSSGIDPTLEMVLTMHSKQDEIATRVAEALQTPETGVEYELEDEKQDQVQEQQPTVLVNTPKPGETPMPTNALAPAPAGYLIYRIQSGDTLEAIERRFEVNDREMISSSVLQKNIFLESGHSIYIPFDPNLHEYGPDQILIPDGAIVDGLLDAGFDLEAYVMAAGGYLSRYSENSRGEIKTGIQIIQEISDMHSISPKLLLAVVEFQSGWVFGDDYAMTVDKYPIGYGLSAAPGLYEELYIVARELGKGYYWWREGLWPEVYLSDEHPLVLHPSINAGTAALSNLMSGLYSRQNWSAVLYGQDSFTALYTKMYGDPFDAVLALPEHIPFGLSQPEMVLPFQSGEDYHLTSGPHRAWGYGSPWAAIDFAPADALQGCTISPFWVTSATAGLVVRSEEGKVLVDVDMDGDESTGWVIFYLHIASSDRVSAGAMLNVDDRIGHASCEGGVASGSHVHIARKYNGEWITAGGPIPMTLSGWITVSGRAEYGGYIQRGSKIVYSYPYSIAESRIWRD